MHEKGRTGAGTKASSGQRRGAWRTLAATFVLLSMPGLAHAELELQRVTISAGATATITSLIPTPPFTQETSLVDFELERARAPLFAAEATDIDGNPVLGDFTAAADVLTTLGFGGDHPYAAAEQNITSNAVAAHTSYSDATRVRLVATTLWEARVKNRGGDPLPVEFSFYISGGGLDLHCTVCPFEGLRASVYAAITTGSPSGTLTPWTYSATLVGSPPFGQVLLDEIGGLVSAYTPPTLNPTELAAFSTHDDLGIGLPQASLQLSGDGDPFTRVEIDEFNGVANLGMLAPGEEMIISYQLGAAVAGVNSAYASAWLVDPFSLGSPPGSVPAARFALNGIPVSLPSAVPVPASAPLMFGALAVLLGRRARRVRCLAPHTAD